MIQKVLGNQAQGKLFVVSAPAGTGKTTLVSMLKKEFSCVVQSISFTTREKRNGEVDGVHYRFITKDEFEQRIGNGDFLEYVTLYGNYYGTSKSWVDEHLKQGKHVVLVIDTQGVLLLKNKLPLKTIFIMPPSLDELRRRLTQRKTEVSSVIDQRVEWAKEEVTKIGEYDYVIPNEDVAVAYDILRSIFIAEEHRLE